MTTRRTVGRRLKPTFRSSRGSRWGGVGRGQRNTLTHTHKKKKKYIYIYIYTHTNNRRSCACAMRKEMHLHKTQSQDGAHSVPSAEGHEGTICWAPCRSHADHLPGRDGKRTWHPDSQAVRAASGPGGQVQGFTSSARLEIES